ncbi:hypothetical protein P5673_029159 [Acropora cervicornis]|uniref:Uncharacterized protein n=1 Tax=Acropora cervicornis TaxID=6130 RepID=A0AAD9UUB7_ACRCE|nr:hypothetical protein P5673_029159 [Acropora cervicornis]
MLLVVLGASSEPTGDLHLFELLSETETGNEERELSDVAIQCDIGFVWWTYHFLVIKGIGKKTDAVVKHKDCENAGLSLLKDIKVILRHSCKHEGDQRSLKNSIQDLRGTMPGLLPLRNPARKQQLKNLCHSFHSNETECKQGHYDKPALRFISF